MPSLNVNGPDRDYVLGIGDMQAGIVVMGIGKAGGRSGKFAILLCSTTIIRHLLLIAFCTRID